MLKFIGTLLGLTAIIYGLFAGYVYLFQNRLIYVPYHDLYTDPGDAGLDFKDVYLTTADNIIIHGWFVPGPEEEEKGVVLFCHGNAGNISHRLQTLEYLHSLNMSTLIFDYRGFGKSQGSPHEQGTYKDVRAAWDYLTKDRGINQERIFIMGRSLGGAVAADLAAEKSPAGIVLESTFTSIPDIGKDIFFFLPVKLLAKYSYSTKEKLQRFTSPVMIIHSPEDEIIPFRHGRNLYEQAPEPKYFLEIQGDHNSGFQLSRDKYLHGLGEFFSAQLSD